MTIVDLDAKVDPNSKRRIIVENLRYVFLLIYHIESYIKMKGLNMFFFKDGWNIFDLSILIISDIVLILVIIEVDLPIQE